MLILRFVLLTSTVAGAYKIAIFGLQAAGSHVIFNSRVAEELADAGNNVTLFLLRISRIKLPTVPLKDTVKKYIVEMVPDLDFFGQMDIMQKQVAFAVTGKFNWNMRKMMPMIARTFIGACEKMLQNNEFIEYVRTEKFDLAFTPVVDLCFVGLVHHVGIPTWIWLSTTALTDTMAATVGVPSPPSYVPSLMQAATDQMSFFQRTITFLLSIVQPILWEKYVSLLTAECFRFIMDPETALFRKYIDPDFPDLIDLGRQCQLVMVNSNELYDLARPVLHKTVYIGGIGMKSHMAQPLKEVNFKFQAYTVWIWPFKSLLEKHERIVLMSFGSIANASLMPEDWKTAFLGAFRQFPEYEFIVRYDQADLNDRLPGNVHMHAWLPQQELMQNDKVKALIAHGGYNSMQEAINAGKPMVAIPLFGDQPRNALIVQKLGLGIAIEKADINQETIENALNAVLKDDSYKMAAEKLHKMVLMKPVSPEQLLVKWTGFLAEFKQLPNLTPFGIYLNFVQYFCLDIIAFLLVVAGLLLLVFYSLSKLIYRSLRSLVSRVSGRKLKSA